MGSRVHNGDSADAHCDFSHEEPRMTRPDPIQLGIDAQAAWTELANIIPLLR